MKFKQSPGSRLFDALNYAFISALMLTMLYPLFNVIALSLSNADQVALGNVTFFPRGINLSGYQYILHSDEIAQGYLNTVLYTGAGTFISLLFTSMMAYPLIIKDLAFKRTITVFITITMFFSGGLIPAYLNTKALGLINSFWVMVIPGSVYAYNVIMYRTFFQQLPYDLREAALMDGANDIYILFRVYMPLSKPLLATFALFTMVATWNSWFNAFLYLTDENMHPLQMILRKLIFTASFSTSQSDSAAGQMASIGALHPKNIQMAVVVVTILPILCVYPFLQKYFTKGFLVGAIKG